MKEQEFRAWLEAGERTPGTVSTQMSKVRKIEARFDNLDELIASGEIAGVAKILADPASAPADLGAPRERAHLKQALRYYRRFADDPLLEIENGSLPEATLFIVTNLLGDEDSVERFIERAEWTLKDDCGSEMNRLVRSMKPGDILAMREWANYLSNLPFETKGNRVSAGRFRAIGKVTAQRDDGVGVGVDWTVLPEPKLWYFYNYNRAVWRPPVEREEAAIMLREFLLDDVQQDYDYFIARWWRKDNTPALDQKILAQLKARFEAKHLGFTSFGASESFAGTEGAYKRALVARANELVRSSDPDNPKVLGGALLDLLSGKGGLASNLLDWRIVGLIDKVRAGRPGLIERATGELARNEDAKPAMELWVQELWPMLQEHAQQKPYAESRTIPSMVRALVDPDGAFPIRSTPTDNAAKMLLGTWAFGSHPLSGEDIDTVTGLADALFGAMKGWGWQPRDYWDVQGFVWETCQKRLTEAESDDEMNTQAHSSPTNLILYGPPGTGKTYRTAREAVRLCDGMADFTDDEEGRSALMERYAQLVKAERIEFVTFHQNFSYEDFVEGLRPTQTDEDGNAISTGFRLAPEAGVFSRLAERAEVLPASGATALDLTGRRFFKMSLGEVANPEDDYLYDEAVEGGFIHLGGDSGMDWSEDRFTDKDSMIAGYSERHPEQVAPGKLAGPIEFPHQMRNAMRTGDIVIISKGNLAFRAIAEVTGPFHQVARDDDYTMRRTVRWLWRDDEGLGYDIINNKRFSQRTVYEIAPSQLKLDALASLIEPQSGSNGQGLVAKPYVLIIDEINRANISKVFGELITLIEPDKRLGQRNALKVRLPYSKREFGVPANLHIIGTMNTADRSIALLDTALRRRFRFEEIAPDPALLGENVGGVPLRRVLEVMNERIEYLHSREHRIGHAFFMGAETRPEIDAVMRDKVLPLLQEYFFDDWSRIAAVMGKGFVAERKLTPPPGLDLVEERVSWSVRSEFSQNAYDVLIGKASATETPLSDDVTGEGE